MKVVSWAFRPRVGGTGQDLYGVVRAGGELIEIVVPREEVIAVDAAMPEGGTLDGRIMEWLIVDAYIDQLQDSQSV